MNIRENGGRVASDATINSASLRKSNILQLVSTLRSTTSMSRTELASAVGLAVQSVHRLVDNMVALGLVGPAPSQEDSRGRGRPAVRFQFLEDRALLIGVDVGSETTRVALATLGGAIERTMQFPTVSLHDDLVGGLSTTLSSLLVSHADGRPLVAVGVGVPSVVDSAGTLVQPWLAHKWTGTELGAELAEALGCPVVVAQDNHLSSLAENSKFGTSPDASCLVVVELGMGIGAGMVCDGRLHTGSHGRFGRLMQWPCAAPEGMEELGTTLGELLVADGLINQYGLRGGDAKLRRGTDLFAAALSGDTCAIDVLEWAAARLDEVLRRISLFADPDMIVVGGGIGRGLYAAPTTAPFLQGSGRPYATAISTLGTDAVVIGGVLAAQERIDEWLMARIDEESVILTLREK